MKHRSPSFSIRQLAAITAASILLLLLVVGIGLFSFTRPAWLHYQQQFLQTTGTAGDPVVRSITPTLTGQPELCTTCHLGIEEIERVAPCRHLRLRALPRW